MRLRLCPCSLSGGPFPSPSLPLFLSLSQVTYHSFFLYRAVLLNICSDSVSHLCCVCERKRERDRVSVSLSCLSFWAEAVLSLGHCHSHFAHLFVDSSARGLLNTCFSPRPGLVHRERAGCAPLSAAHCLPLSLLSLHLPSYLGAPVWVSGAHPPSPHMLILPPVMTALQARLPFCSQVANSKPIPSWLWYFKPSI